MNEEQRSRYESKEYLRTLVRHEDKLFFVCTINRLSSAQEGPFEMSETMAWEIEPKTEKRGALVGAFAGSANSSAYHYLCVERLLENGHAEEDEDYEDEDYEDTTRVKPEFL
jgi:hypothetical protein